MNYVVYRHFNNKDELLYVGFTGHILNRTYQHVENKDWAKEIAKITLEHFEDKQEALNKESEYQKLEKPKYLFPRKSMAESRLQGYVRTLLRFDYEWVLTYEDAYTRKAVKEGLMEKREGDNKERNWLFYLRLNPLKKNEIVELTNLNT